MMMKQAVGKMAKIASSKKTRKQNLARAFFSSIVIPTCEVETTATVDGFDCWTERVVTAQCRGVHCVGVRVLVSCQGRQTTAVELVVVISMISLCSGPLNLAIGTVVKSFFSMSRALDYQF